MSERFVVEYIGDHGRGSYAVVDLEHSITIRFVVSYHRNEKNAERACARANRDHAATTAANTESVCTACGLPVSDRVHRGFGPCGGGASWAS